MFNRMFHSTLAFAVIAAAAGTILIHAQEVKPIPGPGHYRAKQILGSKVTIEGNAAVGFVDDIVLDDNGNVDYLIVENSDKRLVTIPWDATRFHIEKRLAIVHVTPEKFKRVPTYTVEEYPQFSAPVYRTKLYNFYGLTPAKERRTIERVGLDIP